jgi:hypothetical protein
MIEEGALPPRRQPFPPLPSIESDGAGGEEKFVEVYQELWGITTRRNRDLVGVGVYPDMDVMMGIVTRALFKVGELYSRCSHRRTGGVAARGGGRGGASCRACMRELGFLVDVGLAGGLVQGVGYSSAVDMVEDHLVESVACLHALVKLLSPLHPEVFKRVKKRKELAYLGQWRAAARRTVRELGLHKYSEVRRDWPKVLIDLMMAHYDYATDEMLQAGQGVLPWEPEMLPPQMDLPAHFDYDGWLKPPASFVEVSSFLVDVYEYNLLTGLGVDFRPVREDRYPLRYYGAYGRTEYEGLSRMDLLSEHDFCRYRVEGVGMRRDMNWEDYPDLSPEYMQLVREEIAEELGLVAQAEEAMARMGLGSGDF